MLPLFQYFYTKCMNCFNIFLNNNYTIPNNSTSQPLLNNQLRLRGYTKGYTREYKNYGNVIDTSHEINPFEENDTKENDMKENDDWVIEFYNELQNPT